MDYFIESASLDQLTSDCVIVGIYENQELTAAASQLDQCTQNLISTVLQRGDLKAKTGETLLINFVPNSAIARILLVGLGKQAPLFKKDFHKALAAAIKTLKDHTITSACCTLAEVEVATADWAWKTRRIVEVFDDALYQLKPLKSIPDPVHALKKMGIWAPESALAEATSGLHQGIAIADAVTLTKRLSDLPGNICTPTYLAEQAIQLTIAKPTLKVDILEEADMQKLGMRSLLSVSRGSRQPAKLIALHYQGGESQAKPIIIIGKGLTFDAGGISLKTAEGMDEMKYDMCGGASVLGILQAAAQLALPLNIVGLVPSSENMPDGDANKPGDIVTSMSGKTIEILNTDAEGRLILCDTLTYAQKYNPDVVIDMATLTGACIVALGRIPSALYGNDDKLCQDLINASESACDSVWRMPLWEEYQEQLKSNFADLANIGGKDGGSITAACFLARFAETFRWAHLDIAGTAWRTGANKGATGRPVPLVMQYLLNRASGRNA
ncbi:MAG: leucyl aminopeptidase [Methylococcaceae bacterium]|nr:leucyl aminopeptidase [Methylococcaceae bacterium]